MASRIGTNALLSMLGDWRRIVGTSLHGRLTDSLRNAITSGVLIPGTRLPSERTLSRALGVSRATVTTSLNELKSAGLLDAKHGSGTVVCGSLGTGPEGAKVLPGLLGEWGGIDLAASSPTDAGSLPNVDVNLDALLAAGPSHGYVPAGLPELRNAVAERFTLGGLATTSSQVLVTNGAQHALALAFSQLTKRGDPILVDEPTYPGVIDLLAARGLRPVGLPRRTGGFDLDGLRRLVAKHDIKLAYLQTSVHNPTGYVATDRELSLLAECCDDLGITVLEDLVLADLRYDGSSLAPLAARVAKAPVVVVGSVSKLGWGGLRIGWLRGQAGLIDRLIRSRLADDLGSSIPSQVISTAILANFDVIRGSRQAALKAKAELAVELLAEHCPGSVAHVPHGGLSLWIDLPDSSAEALAQRATQNGVVIATGAAASVESAGASNIRICFDRPEAQLAEGIRRLGVAWHEAPAVKANAAP